MSKRRGTNQPAFTLLELLVVITLIIILAVMIYIGIYRMESNAKLARVTNELTAIANAATEYAQDNNNTYPADVSRGIPPGIQPYLAGGLWPISIWPHGVFDWDNWTTVNGQPSPQILQISYRLCGLSDPVQDCSDPVLFPDFTRDSAIFYCISGPCIPHQSDPTAPAYCVNCNPKNINRKL
jgi:prepilin-type N-terminal cleavage/methylation domain-containing protein